jgi:hypothetical protein
MIVGSCQFSAAVRFFENNFKNWHFSTVESA